MGAAQNQGTVVDLDLQHPYLRNCKTRTTANGTDLLATIPAQLPTYKAWKKQIDSLTTSLAVPNYILLATGHSFDQGGVCSTSGQLHLEYEYYPRLLSSEIAIRKRQGRRFTEGELWYLLYALAMSKDSLSENGEVIGDVHPRNVFLNDIGQVKVACLRSWPGQVSNYRRAVLEEEWGYLAPEDIERLKLGAMDNQINTESQIFSIGLVLLSTAILQLQQEIYEMKERDFLEEIFFSRLGKFQHDSLYSQIFRAVISNLLEIEPLKRMNLHELKAFLQKHTENIIVKKPLKIDNVGKKLQITINAMLKTVRPGVTNERPPQQPQQPNIVAQNLNVAKGGMRVSGQRILKNINFEERPPVNSVNNLPQPYVRNQTNIQANYHQKPPIINPSNSSAFYTKPPFPPPHVVPIITSNEQPHRPTINKVFSSTSVGPIITKTESTKIQSPPKYKPFESITNKGQNQQITPSKVQQTKILKQQPSIEFVTKENKQIKTTQQIKQLGQKPTVTQIWMGQETSIGQLNFLMETMREGFDHNSLINPKYEPECIQTPQQVKQVLRNSKDVQQGVVSEVKEESEESPQDQSEHNQSKISKKSEKPETPISNSLLKQSQVHKCQAEKSQANNDSSLLKSSARISQNEKANQKWSKNFVQNKGNQLMRQSQSKNSQASKQSNKIEVVQLQANNETKPLSPLVKVWGMKMGLTKNKNEGNPSQATTNIKEVQVSSQKNAVKSFQASAAAVQTDKSLASNLRQERCLLQSQVARRQSQIKNDISFQNRQKHKEHVIKSKNDASLLVSSESKQESLNIVLQNNDYILIQDESKYTNVQESHSYVRDNNFIKQSIKQQESEIIQYHTYADIVTEGTFEECWQEMLILLRDPTDYTNKIDPNKVKMRILDDRWSLRVGPGVFDILLNKEEGKFLLKNCEGSRCEGQMLGGVYKDEDKKHRIWFNSAYYYKGSKIPSREIIEECLKRCQANIAKQKK